MARKNVFSKALQAAQDTQESETTASDGATEDLGTGDDRRTAPNVRYFGASFEEQLRRTAQDIDPDQIDMGPVRDRIDLESGLEDLVDTIRESGQQVPALVRKTDQGRYVAVYGRRRILACRRLGRPVRAIITEFSEEEALIAQGLENAARLDTSYIEKALFAARIESAGFESGVIQKALRIDKTTLSRYRRITQDIPEDVINAIGAAHGAGRRQWEALRKYVIADGAPSPARLLSIVDDELESVDRLADLITKLKAPAPDAVESGNVSAQEVARGVAFKRRPRVMTVNVAKEADPDFLDYLETRLTDLYTEWSTLKKKE